MYSSDFVNQTKEGIFEAAIQLRETILKLRSTKLPSPLTVEAIVAGQTKPPDELLLFYRLLYTGSAELDESNDRSERYILSSAEDDLYKATNGKIKPAKHLLGMGIKSLTGSRKVQETINHFGHCVGYHCTEEIETELAKKYIAGRSFFTRWTECYT